MATLEDNVMLGDSWAARLLAVAQVEEMGLLWEGAAKDYVRDNRHALMRLPEDQMTDLKLAEDTLQAVRAELRVLSSELAGCVRDTAQNSPEMARLDRLSEAICRVWDALGAD